MYYIQLYLYLKDIIIGEYFLTLKSKIFLKKLNYLFFTKYANYN